MVVDVRGSERNLAILSDRVCAKSVVNDPRDDCDEGVGGQASADDGQ
ncbi:MAG: hypothetical protein RLZZ40_721, partial [Actinomycetota bacterium]